MEEREEAKVVSKKDYQKGEFKINEQLIKVKSTNSEDTKNNQENNKYKIWEQVINKFFENQIYESMKDYKARTGLIDEIVSNAIKNNINGLVIDFGKIQEKEVLQRFLIEITPKLREMGITTCVVLNDNMEKNDYKNIVDYIVE